MPPRKKNTQRNSGNKGRGVHRFTFLVVLLLSLGSIVLWEIHLYQLTGQVGGAQELENIIIRGLGVEPPPTEDPSAVECTWTKWSSCSVTCGTGMQERKRSSLPQDAPDGAHCIDEETMWRECHAKSCVKDPPHPKPHPKHPHASSPAAKHALEGKASAGETDHSKDSGTVADESLDEPPGDELEDEAVHVCFCTDDPDLRPLVAAVNSSLTAATDPGRIQFHLVTSHEAHSLFEQRLQAMLGKGVHLEVHSNLKIQQKITKLITFRKSSGARKSLSSPFNFAPFYLDEYLKGNDAQSHSAPKRVVYLDTDVIVQGDIAELASVDLGEHAVGTVEDCSQRFEIYFDFEELAKQGAKHIDKKACVFNRGVFVVDTVKWKKQGIGAEIEKWMAKYSDTKKDLYKFGMSQPPWLLALHKRHQPIGEDWNCRGLSRANFVANEQKELSKKGFKPEDMKHLGVKGTSPYVAPCTAKANVLHYNGPKKPWDSKKRGELNPKKASALCALQPETAKRRSENPGKHGVLQAAGLVFVDCAELWWAHISDEAALAGSEEHK